MTSSAVVQLAGLNGINGFQIKGVNPFDTSGDVVASAGDVNGDGFDDIIIGALGSDPEGIHFAGSSYVVFGAEAGFAPSLNLSDLDGTNGFRIDGVEAHDFVGRSVASGGDLNGDGLDDIIIGVTSTDRDEGNNFGASYVVFGAADGFTPALNLLDLNGDRGFRIDGAAEYDYSGHSVASAGDVNGDGLDDIVIGALGAGTAGESYVVFGTETAFDPALNLSAIDGNNGFKITGLEDQHFSGQLVASAGDVNGDGFDDILMGAQSGAPEGKKAAGISYVIFGGATGSISELNLSELDGINGFRINGKSFRDFSGRSVASAGDVNGDGFDDIIIGAEFADPDWKDSAGESYVIFGAESGFDPEMNLSDLNGINGFQINGAEAGDYSGVSVASAGDVNGDGFDDIIIGAYGSEASAGKSYVIFGREAGFDSTLNLSELSSSIGFRIDGIDTVDGSGWSVSSAGDVNGDGFDDMIVGAPHADPEGRGVAGESYVIFGGPDGFLGSSFFGTDNDDVLVGTSFGEKILALGGNDWILPGAGDDEIDGGAGFDMVSYVDQTEQLIFVQNRGTSTATIADTQDQLTNVESVTGTSQGDIFYASSGYFRGLGGQDAFMASGSGTALYDGGGSADVVSYGTSGSGISESLLRGRGWGGDAQGDRYNSIEDVIGSRHEDFIWGDNGNNWLVGDKGDDVIIGNGGDDYILGDAGTDTIVFSGNQDEYTITHSGIRTEVIHNDGGVDGHDVIGHAEVLRFADGDLIL